MPAFTSPTLENLLSILAQFVICEPEEIGMLDTLADLNLDSLDKTELLITCEESFEIEIPEADAHGIQTVAGLYDAILRAQDLTA